MCYLCCYAAACSSRLARIPVIISVTGDGTGTSGGERMYNHGNCCFISQISADLYRHIFNCI